MQQVTILFRKVVTQVYFYIFKHLNILSIYFLLLYHVFFVAFDSVLINLCDIFSVQYETVTNNDFCRHEINPLNRGYYMEGNGLR